MYVHCAHCGVQIPAEDLNIDTAIARCRACQSVFSFADALQQDAASRQPATAEPGRSPRGRREVPMPRGVRMEDTGTGLRFVRRWFHWVVLLLIVFCVAWDSFLIFWYTMAFRQGAPWIMVVFPIGHLAVGVGLTYYVLCMVLNTTTIEIGDGTLSIRHGPLPWRGNRTLPTMELDQLYCKQRVHHSNSGTHETYELYAIERGGKEHKLLAGLLEPEDALFLEQQIEQYLHLRDRPVPGAYVG
jgi:hypothetical protein